MVDFERIGSLTAQNAEILARWPESLNKYAADLTLRNIVVFCDQLSPKEYDSLPEATKEKVDQIVRFSNSLFLKEDGSDTQQHPNESDQDYRYRSEVSDPLNRLQAGVGSEKLEDPFIDTLFRCVLLKAGTAFQESLQAYEEKPEIQNRKNYFWDNALAAAKRINKK